MTKELSRKEKADIGILALFVGVFCRQKHGGKGSPFTIDATDLGELTKGIELCPDCARLLRYGIAMRRRCVLDPKPACKRCPAPCYRPEYRERMRAVMRFSGMYLLKRGRVDVLLHYLL